jgi:hypothetical protein
MRMTAAVAGVLLAIGSTACATHKATPSVQPGRYLITTDELTHSSEIFLFDAIRRLRPNFLVPRGQAAYGAPETTVISLYVNGERMDSIDDLRRISCKEVLEVRFYEPQLANTRFAGHNNAGGAIAVTLRPVDDPTLPADTTSPPASRR